MTEYQMIAVAKRGPDGGYEMKSTLRAIWDALDAYKRCNSLNNAVMLTKAVDSYPGHFRSMLSEDEDSLVRQAAKLADEYHFSRSL